MSKVQTLATVALAASTALLGLTVKEQQVAIEKLVENDAIALEADYQTSRWLADLERRTSSLEAEDERIMAHVRWYIQERSGIRELARLERAMEERDAK